MMASPAGDERQRAAVFGESETGARRHGFGYDLAREDARNVGNSMRGFVVNLR